MVIWLETKKARRCEPSLYPWKSNNLTSNISIFRKWGFYGWGKYEININIIINYIIYIIYNIYNIKFLIDKNDETLMLDVRLLDVRLGVWLNVRFFRNLFFHDSCDSLSPPRADDKGGLGGLPQTLRRTTRGTIRLNCDVNYLSFINQNWENDRLLGREKRQRGASLRPVVLLTKLKLT